MDNELLTFLKEDPNVFYIYNRGSTIYNLKSETSDTDFLIVVNDKFKVPKRFKQYKYPHHFKRKIRFNLKYNNCDFIIFKSDEWFKMVMDNHLYAWECACLNRKFIHKEHVKLLLTTDLIKLRSNFDEKYRNMTNKAKNALNNKHLDTAIKILWYIIKDGIFTLQIIENHKIVNYNAANGYLNSLRECTEENLLTIFEEKINSIYEKIRQQTDGMIYLNKVKKYANI